MQERASTSEAVLETQSHLLEQEQKSQKQLREELSQWRRYALRCQSEMQELQEKTSRDPQLLSGRGEHIGSYKSANEIDMLLSRLAKAEAALEGPANQQVGQIRTSKAQPHVLEKEVRKYVLYGTRENSYTHGLDLCV